MFSSNKQVILSQEMKGHSNPVMALTEHLDYDWVKFIIIIIIITSIITIIIIITIISHHPSSSSSLSVLVSCVLLL